MLTKRYRTEEILSQLRQAQVELSRGCLLSNTAVVRFDSCPTRSAPPRSAVTVEVGHRTRTFSAGPAKNRAIRWPGAAAVE